MYYKRKNESKYMHYATPEKILLGVDKNFDPETVELVLNTKLQMYDNDFYSKMMKFDVITRSKIIAAVEELEVRTEDKNSFNGWYFEILLDFIFTIYDKTDYDIAESLAEYIEGYEKDDLYRSICKLQKNKKRVSEFNQELVERICSYCKITKDIVKTGKGTLYFVRGGKSYTSTKVNNYYAEHKHVDLEEMIMFIAEVKKEDIIKIPLEIVVSKKQIDKKIYEFLCLVVE